MAVTSAAAGCKAGLYKGREDDVVGRGRDEGGSQGQTVCYCVVLLCCCVVVLLCCCVVVLLCCCVGVLLCCVVLLCCCGGVSGVEDARQLND